MPHAVIGPSQRVLGIGGERFVVPIFGVVIAAATVGLDSSSLFLVSFSQPNPGPAAVLVDELDVRFSD
jgi:hypothetical protein